MRKWRGRYLTNIRPIPVGFDVETVSSKNPRVILLAYSGIYDFETKQFEFLKSGHGGKKEKPRFIENPSLEDMLDFLFTRLPNSHKSGRKKYFGVFYNERYDFSLIIKNALKDPHLVESYVESKELAIGKYLVTYVKGKCFKIKKGKTTRYYYDSANFFKEDNHAVSLNTASERYLGEGKLPDVDRERLGSEEGENYYLQNKEKVLEYCIRDCRLTSRLMSLVIDSQSSLYANLFNKPERYPTFYFSTGSLAKAWLELEHSHLKNSGYIWNYNTLEFIQRAYYGGYNDIWKIGSFSKVSIIDINSAYPYAMSKAVCPLSLILCRGREYHKDASYGVYRIETNYNRLLPTRIKNKLIYVNDENKRKRVEKYVGKQILEYLVENKASIKIIDAVEFFSVNGELEFPDIPLLYEERLRKKKAVQSQGDTNDILQLGLKLLLNSAYGSSEQIKFASPFTNPLLGQMITEDCRVRIWRLIDKIGRDNVLFVSTDSIAFIDKGQLNGEEFSSKLGALTKVLERGQIKIYKSGVYLIRTDEGSSWKLKRRGYSSELTTERILKARKQSISVKFKHVYTIDEGLRLKDITKIGKFVQIERRLNLKSINESRYVDPGLLNFKFLNENNVAADSISPFDMILQDEKFSSFTKQFYARKKKILPDNTWSWARPKIEEIRNGKIVEVFLPVLLKSNWFVLKIIEINNFERKIIN